MLVSANYLAPGYAWPNGFDKILENRERRLFNKNVLGDILHFRPMKRNSDENEIHPSFFGGVDSVVPMNRQYIY